MTMKMITARRMSFFIFSPPGTLTGRGRSGFDKLLLLLSAFSVFVVSFLGDQDQDLLLG